MRITTFASDCYNQVTVASVNLQSIGRRILIPAVALCLALAVDRAFGGGEPVTILPVVSGGVFGVEWNASPDFVYKVQSTDDLDSGVWKIEEPVKSVTSGVVRWTAPEALTNSRYYRLLLPQPEIFSVEPAVTVAGAPVDLYITGQCFSSNDVVTINGVVQTNVQFNGATLLSINPVFTPGTPGTYTVQLTSSSSGQISKFHWTVVSSPSSSQALLEPPNPPPATPDARQKELTGHITLIKRGDSGVSGGSMRQIQARKGEYVGDVLNSVSYKGTWDCDDNDPGVFPASGEVRHQAVDLAVEGRGLDFVWARTYRSRTSSASSLGNGWTHSYDVRCVQNGSDIDVYDGTGRKDTFTHQTNGTYTCPGFFCEGVITGGVFRLNFADTGFWDFNALDGSLIAGKLAHIQDRNGNVIACDYNVDGRLAHVLDTLNRTNTISYNVAGQVSGVTDFSGRTVTYSYYPGGLPGGGPGDLKSVTSPPVTGTPNTNDFPDGKTITYTYSTGYLDERENHLLLSVIDATGQTVREHVYQHNESDYEFLRCISVKRWTNTPVVLSYLPQIPAPSNQFARVRCMMNDSMGNVTECFYDARNRCVKLQQFTGRSTPGVRVSDIDNRPAGKLRSTDPDSYETRFTWNNDSLCTLVSPPTGQQLECLYESEFDSATPARKRADLRLVRHRACCTDADTDGDGVADLTEVAWHYEYDPRFGLGRNYNPATEYLVGDCAIFNDAVIKTIADTTGVFDPTKWEKIDNSGMRTRINELEAKLQAIGLLARVRGWDPVPKKDIIGNAKGWDGTIKGNARGPRQTVSLDGSFSHGTVKRTFDSEPDNQWDGIVPSGNGVAIKTKGTGADKNRIRPKGWDGTIKGRVDFGISAIDPIGVQSTCSYDAQGNRARKMIPITQNEASGENYAYDSHGQLTSITNAADANGYRRVDTFTYYTNGPQAGYLAAWRVDAEGPTLIQATLEHDPRGNVTRCIDPNGKDWLYTYNSLDQCVRSQTPTNLTTRCATDYFYDANNNVQAAIEEVRDDTDTKLGVKTISAGHDPLKRPAFMNFTCTFVNGRTIQFTYDGNDQCVLVRGGEAVAGTDPHQTVSYEYDERRFLWKQVAGPFSPVQSTSEYSYDANGRVTAVLNGTEDPTSASSTWSYDGLGLPATITDPMGNQTSMYFDACDNLKIVRHLGQTNDVPGTTGNIRLAESRFDYDALYRCVCVHKLFFDTATQLPIGGGEATTTFTYSPNGALAATDMQDALHRTSYTYDTVGRPASIIDALTNRIEFTYDALGNVLSATSRELSTLGGPEQDFSRTNVYDSLSRCIQTTDNVGNTCHYSYDSLSHCVKQVDPRGIYTFYSYDLLGRPTMTVRDLDGDHAPNPALDFTEQATWSSSSERLLSTTDANGNTTSYDYDSLDRRTTVTRADGTHMSLVWSPRSNLLSEQDPNGTVIVHSYDANDRCISNHITPGLNVSTDTTFEQFEYDGLSRCVRDIDDDCDGRFAYDSLGHCVSESLNGLATTSVYDALDNRLSLTYPGGRVVMYTFDRLNRCASVVESGAVAVSYDYDGASRVSRISYNNGIRSRIFYDGIAGTTNAPGDYGSGRVSQIRHAPTVGLPVVVVVQARDQYGNNTSRNTAAPVPSPHTNQMTLQYDNVNRLARATVLDNSTPVRDTLYLLDHAGNRTNVFGSLCSGTYFMNALVPGPMDFQMNQYTFTPCDSRQYDDNGNLVGVLSSFGSVLSYTYDCHDRLVAVSDSGTPVATYAYDALGRRISKTVSAGDLGSVTTQLLYDGARVIEERESGAVSTSYLIDDRYLLGLRTGGHDYYLHSDELGNALALTGAGGAVAERYAYDDYGAVTFLNSDGLPTGAASSAVGNVYLFGGMRYDVETRLHCNGDGYLDPLSGRYTSSRAGLGISAIGTWSGGSSSIYASNNPWSGGGGGGGGGGGFAAIENRDTLKTYFETGDVPTQDAIMPRNILKSFFETGDKPTQAQFAALIDSFVHMTDDGISAYKQKPKPTTTVKHEFRGHVTLMK